MNTRPYSANKAIRLRANDAVGSAQLQDRDHRTSGPKSTRGSCTDRRRLLVATKTIGFVVSDHHHHHPLLYGIGLTTIDLITVSLVV